MWAGEESAGVSPLKDSLKVPGGVVTGSLGEVPGSRTGRWQSSLRVCPAPPEGSPATALRPRPGALTAAHPQVQSLHSLHENGALVPLGDALYVTGGRWQGMDGDYHVEMEAYDRARDAWTRHGSLPRLWLYHGASTIFLDVSKWTQPFSPAQEH